jgi:hypothetical protein
MKLGTALALRDAVAGRYTIPREERKLLRLELAIVRNQMIALGREIAHLEDGPASFHSRFWRDLYRSMLVIFSDAYLHA